MNGSKESIPVTWSARKMEGEVRGGRTEAKEVSRGEVCEEGGVGGVREDQPPEGEEKGVGPRGKEGWGESANRSKEIPTCVRTVAGGWS